ncbi:hypothetical protein M407DRAFT_245399 [Tulasnella calospora MUT 4182]|uniref:Uncharacterized protein n=1 Tax=Tulasnella calospora MUT 4182 TaxID=1051891 RepID=A0A0C3LK23_9AGAM|nr:hypothetical protein M407DRAFT_245399 [Tulasnella calospora MUT 4182]
MEDSGRPNCRLAPDWREVLPWDAAAHLAENGAWFPTLPWNVPCRATGGLVPIQCTGLERIAEGGPLEGGNENNWRPIFFPQWLDPKTLIEHSNGRIQDAGCNCRSPIRLPHHTWVSRSMLEMLKTSTCGLYMLWIGSRPDAGRQLAELHLIRLPAPATLDQGLSFEESSTRLEVSLPLEDVSYTAFSEEKGLLALAIEREGGVTNKVHLFYY